jgi:hypothetical protein
MMENPVAYIANNNYGLDTPHALAFGLLFRLAQELMPHVFQAPKVLRLVRLDPCLLSAAFGRLKLARCSFIELLRHIVVANTHMQQNQLGIISRGKVYA